MGAGAQLRAGGPRREDRVLSELGTTPPRLGRVALILLVPALLVLPAAVVLAGFFGFGGGSGMGGVLGLIVLVFTFVLLGSMTLNAWLVLRHPRTLADRALPHAPSVTLIVLWGLMVIWTIVLAVGRLEVISVVLGAALAIVSIVTFFQVIGRPIDPVDRLPLAAVELSTTARALAWVYLVLAGITLLSTLYFAIVGGGLNAAAGALGGPQTIPLLLLGLPWSHPVYFVAVVLGFGLSSLFGIAASVVVALAVVANIVLVSLLLFDPVRRTKLVNWFFKLNPKTPAPQPID